MKNNRLQCKDIPTFPILKFLSRRPGKWHNWFPDHEYDVGKGMPVGTPRKLVWAKMSSLIRRKLVDGCDCGCRGDYVITEKGLQLIAKDREAYD